MNFQSVTLKITDVCFISNTHSLRLIIKDVTRSNLQNPSSQELHICFLERGRHETRRILLQMQIFLKSLIN